MTGHAVTLQPIVELLILTVSGCVGQSGSSLNGCPTGQVGLFPDPNSCRYYIECSITEQGQQTSYRHQCPSANPYFVASQTVGFGYCSANVPTGNTNCQLQDFPQTANGSQLPITMFPPYSGNTQGQGFTCPRFLVCNRTSLNGLYGDPTSCNRYYQCVDYVAYQFTCPTGMQWSETIRLCDWSYRANCNLQARQSQGYLCNDGSSAAIDQVGMWRLILCLLAVTFCWA